jgi:MoaA/NifB/PqqE/SkfB family radical SAM enzyme
MSEPRILILSLATACACHCEFCGFPDTRPHQVMSSALVEQVLLRNGDEHRWLEVNITGGDPLALPSTTAALETVARLSRAYERLSVSTAGVPAPRCLRNLDLLRGVDPLEIFVSLDGLGELHDRIRGRRDAFENAMRFVDAARTEHGRKVSFTCVICRSNVDHLDKIADYAAEIGVPISYSVVNWSDYYINSASRYGQTALLPTQLSAVTDFLARRHPQSLADDLTRVLRGGRRETPCNLLESGVMVMPDGKMSICGTSESMVFGEIGRKTRSWQELMLERSRHVAGGANQACRTCTVNCFAERGREARASR